MTDFRPFTIIGRRYSSATYDHGHYVASEPDEISFSSGVQTPTPNDLELLDEGKRTLKSIVLFTEFELHLAIVDDDPDKNVKSDQVQWENEWYEVNVVKPYMTMFPGNYKAVCTKIENKVD